MKATELLDDFDSKKVEAVLADKGYDADYIVAAIGNNISAEVVIPPKINRKVLRYYDKELYKQRNLIERLFNRIKNFRRVATRYDKTASSFLVFIQVACVFIWGRRMSTEPRSWIGAGLEVAQKPLKQVKLKFNLKKILEKNDNFQNNRRPDY